MQNHRMKIATFTVQLETNYFLKIFYFVLFQVETLLSPKEVSETQIRPMPP